MSYLHCPTCARAYNVAREPSCPRCGKAANVAASVATIATVATVASAPPPQLVATRRDPVADIVVAATALARAIARATPAERDAARASLGLVREQIVAAVTRPRIRPQLVIAAAAALVGRVAPLRDTFSLRRLLSRA